MEENFENQIVYSQEPKDDVPLDGSLLSTVSNNMSFIGIFSIIGAVLLLLFVLYVIAVGSKYGGMYSRAGGPIVLVMIFLIIFSLLLIISGVFLRKGKYAFEQFFRTSSLDDFHNGIEMQIRFFSIHIALLVMNIIFQILSLFEL